MAAAHGSTSLLGAPNGALRIILHSRFPYPGYYSTLQNGATNPTGPETGKYRVVRGGSWYSDLEGFMRVAYRDSYDPDVKGLNFGFRCVRSQSITPFPTATFAPTLTPTATTMPTSTPGTDPLQAALTETHSFDMGVSLQLPEGWVTEVADDGTIYIANVPGIFDSSTLETGQIGMIILDPAVVASLGSSSLSDTLNTIVASFTSDSGAPIDVTETTIGGHPAARVNLTQTGVEGMFLAIEFDEGTVVLFAATAENELAANEALLLDIAASVNYTAPAQ